MKPDLFTPLTMPHGPQLANRLLLAPLTNQQSHTDGTASEADFSWIESCARNGYSMIMTCAANVQANGKAFKGQLGIWNDAQLPGLTHIADIIRRHGGVSSVQLHHGGMRAGFNLPGYAVGPTANSVYSSRGLTQAEVAQLRDDFIAAARRAQKAGFDGVEVHAAFGWILSQFLSVTLNQRRDSYGGSVENRARLIFEIIDGIRQACRSDFQIGLRLSLERYGMQFGDIVYVAERALREGQIDYLDLAPWDIENVIEEGEFAGRRAIDVFTALPRGDVRIGASGKIMSAVKAREALNAGLDFVMIGRAAILQNDFPHQIREDPEYVTPALPVSAHYLSRQGLSPDFINYMRTWNGFVAE